MADFTPDWAADFTVQLSSVTIADAANDDTSYISHDGKWGTEVAVEVVYGNPATEGVKVYVAPNTGAAVAADLADSPWGFEMPYTASTTHHRHFFVDGTAIGSFRVLLTNDSGAAVTATLGTKQLDKIVSA